VQVRWSRWAGLLGVGLLGLTACESGIGRNPDVPRSTIEAYETRVVDLQGELDRQRPTIEALSLTPPPPAATPVPFASRWQLRLSGEVKRQDAVGVRDGLTPMAAKGAFVVVPVMVTNREDAPAPFNPVGSLQVVDDQQRVFDIDPDASGAAYVLDFGFDPAVGPLQPGISYRNVLVFDVAPDSKALVLRSVDGSLDLPLGV
jgi:hypothetical protein